MISISVMCQYARLQCFQGLTLHFILGTWVFQGKNWESHIFSLSYLNLLGTNNQFSFNNLDLNLVLTLSFNYSLSPKVFFSILSVPTWWWKLVASSNTVISVFLDSLFSVAKPANYLKNSSLFKSSLLNELKSY